MIVELWKIIDNAENGKVVMLLTKFEEAVIDRRGNYFSSFSFGAIIETF